MILANVNIGTGPSSGDGSPLRSAFSIINNNFQLITNNVNALTNSVTSVAGRTGNVILTINDILGINLYATNASVDSKIAANIANVGGGGSTYSNVNVAAYLTVNGYTTTVYVNTANTSLKNYVDGQITAANAAVVAANLGMKGYVDSIASQSIYGNSNVASYLVTNGYVNSNSAYANSNVKSYFTSGFDGNILPSANVAYSLGSITNQWKDLFVSNNTIFIGGVPLSVDAGGNLLVNGNTVSGGGGAATGITSNDDIFITNSIGGANVADIRIESADDIILQAKDRLPGFSSEGGDINIYAGDGADDDGAVGSGNAGDIQIFAGNGGAAGTYDSGGSGGFVSIRGGVGGAASATYNADNGGDVTIIAGDSGDNGGDTSRGNFGGDIGLQAGATTLEDENGGDINLTTGVGGAGSAQSGEVRITIPATGAFPGGEWVFSGTGRTLSTPQNAEIFGAGAGNLTIGSAGNTFIRSVNYSTVTPYTWQFSDVGILTLPGEGVIQSLDDTINLTSLNTTSGFANTVYLGSGGGLGFTDQAIGGNWLEIFRSGVTPEIKAPTGNLLITSVVPGVSSNTWTFGQNGSLTFPDNTVQTTAWTGNITGNIIVGNSRINFVPNSSGDGFGYSTIEIRPDDVNTSMDNYLIIDPTSPNHIHIRAGGAQDNSNAELYLGGENSHFVVNNGLNPIVAISANNHVWEYNTDGTITFPDSTVQTTAWTGSSYSNVQVATYLPTYTGNIAAGNVFVTTAYRFASGAVTITNDSSSVVLTPDTGANALAGVRINGNGYLLGPNGARNITLNYNGVSGAVGLQGNVTVGSAGSGNLFVGGNIIARDITAGNIIATGTSGVIGFNSGGFVQQATSNATQVTSNTTSGNIQLMSLNLGVASAHTVTFACNKLTTNDMLVVKHVSGGLTSVYVDAYVASDGLAIIWLRNISGGDTGNFTPMLKYAIIRAPSS